MAKRHHASHRPKGHYAAHTGHHSSHLSGRMGDAEEDGRQMIREDHRAIANLPQEVMIKPYPVHPGYMPDHLDDTISGIDRQIHGDHSATMRGLKPMKF